MTIKTPTNICPHCKRKTAIVARTGWIDESVGKFDRRGNFVEIKELGNAKVQEWCCYHCGELIWPWSSEMLFLFD